MVLGMCSVGRCEAASFVIPRLLSLWLTLALTQPAFANAQTNQINAYLQHIAQQNGQVYAHHVPYGVPAPSVGAALNAIHALPPPSTVPHFEVIADPTPAELPFILPGATDGNGCPVPDPVPGLLFGTITPKDTDAYGIDHYDGFDDLSNATIPDPTMEVPADLNDPDQGNDIICNPAYKQYVLDAAAYQTQVEAQADIDAAAQEAENQIVPDQEIIYTPIAYAKSLIEFTKSYGLIHTSDSMYCMYGRANGLSTGECWRRGRILAFNPVTVLKQMPAARSDKSLKAAAAYITVRYRARR
jgi:hypothetical protein